MLDMTAYLTPPFLDIPKDGRTDGGQMDGWKSSFKDFLQQTKMLLFGDYVIPHL